MASYETRETDDEDPKKLIPELCNHFYHLGWASGTGGGLSIRKHGYIYCAPSGVQKERIQPDDIFVLLENGDVSVEPKNPSLKCSECLPLFMVVFTLRNAGCCIHSHSVNANLITELYSKRSMEYNVDKYPRLTTSMSFHSCLSSYLEFRISSQEMIKGIKRGCSDESLQYNDTLVVPIIDNVPHERDLTEGLKAAVLQYPDTNAILVRNHGVYVWGKTWQQAKSHAECYDYLFKLKLEALKCGFDWMFGE